MILKVSVEKSQSLPRCIKDFIKDHIGGWKTKNNIKCPIIVDDNTKPHLPKSVHDFLDAERISLWIQLTYSPDIHPCDFNCFGPLKLSIKRNRYQGWDVETLLKNAIQNCLSKDLYQGVKKLLG